MTPAGKLSRCCFQNIPGMFTSAPMGLLWICQWHKRMRLTLRYMSVCQKSSCFQQGHRVKVGVAGSLAIVRLHPRVISRQP